MKKIDVLKAVLKKAKKNGFKYEMYPTFHEGMLFNRTNYYAFIFREDFAKAI